MVDWDYCGSNPFIVIMINALTSPTLGAKFL